MSHYHQALIRQRQQAIVIPESDDGPPAPKSLPALTCIATILIIALFYMARVVFLPLTVALLLGFFFRPVVRRMAKAGIPPSLGSLTILGLLVSVLVGAIMGLQAPFQEWVSKLPEAIHELKHRGEIMYHGLSQVPAAAAVAESLTAGGVISPAPQTPVADATTGTHASGVDFGIGPWATYMLSGASEFMASTLVMILTLYFLLAEGDIFLQRLIGLLPGLTAEPVSNDLIMGSHPVKSSNNVLYEIEGMIFSYLGTITVINFALGVLVALVTSLVGLSNPLLWGTMAFLLNYLPYIGPSIGAIILTLASFLTFPDIGQALLAPVAYVCLIVIEGNVLTPTILGKRLAINPLAVFIWLLFVGWMWGIVGAIIAVPILMVGKIVCERLKGLGNLAALIGA